MSDPNQVRRSDRDGSALLFSKWFETIRTGRYLVIVTICQNESNRYWVITAYTARKLSGGTVYMDKNLTFRYDQIGDILYIDLCPPYAEQESEEIGDEIIARFNPESDEMENLEILFFSKRFTNQSLFELPILADVKLAG